MRRALALAVVTASCSSVFSTAESEARDADLSRQAAAVQRVHEEEQAHRRAEKTRQDELRAIAARAAEEHREQLASLRSNEGVIRHEWSALACFWAGWREAALAEAQKEQRYGAEFGAVSLEKLYRARQRAELADDRAAAAREALREMKTEALPCDEDIVWGIAQCIEKGSAWCSKKVGEQDSALILDLAYELDPHLRNFR